MKLILSVAYQLTAVTIASRVVFVALLLIIYICSNITNRHIPFVTDETLGDKHD